MTNQNDLTIIIGGGPAGASAAIYLARSCHPVMLIDTPRKVPGRTAMGVKLNNYLGHDKVVTGKEFLSRVSRQLNQLPIERKDEKVLKVAHKNSFFEVLTDRPAKHKARYLIVAVGFSDNMPAIKGIESYFDTAVFHCMTCDWYERRNKKIAIVSDDDRGLINALRMVLYHRPPKLSVMPSKDNPKYSKDLIKKAQKEGVKIYQSPLVELIGAKGMIKKLKLADGQFVEAEVMFTRLGNKRFDDFLEKIKIERDEEGFIKVNPRTFESSIKNLFAIGPINDGPDQAVIAAGEGAMCALEIDKCIIATHGIQ